jgi:hypothetical protein
MRRYADAYLDTVVHAANGRKHTMMALLSTLTLSLHSGWKDKEPHFGGAGSMNEFPSGQLTSTPWEGWWHDEA